jgi:hypothetical protein
MFKHSWRLHYITLDHIRNVDIWKELRLQPVQIIEEYTQNWINHLGRMTDGRISKHILQYKPKGRPWKKLSEYMKSVQALNAYAGVSTWSRYRPWMPTHEWIREVGTGLNVYAGVSTWSRYKPWMSMQEWVREVGTGLNVYAGVSTWSRYKPWMPTQVLVREVGTGLNVYAISPSLTLSQLKNFRYYVDNIFTLRLHTEFC